MRQTAKKFSTGLLLAAITFLAVPAGSAIGQTGAVKTPPKQESSDIRPLESGKEIERELAGGATHLYSINLAAGQFVRVVVEQRGVDVVATLIEPGGKKIVEMDSLNRKEGPETVMAIVEVTGNYRLEVRSPDKDAAAGKYVARLQEVRSATEADRKNIAELNEAMQLEAQFAKLYGEGKYGEAESYGKRILAIREKILGENDLETALALYNLASLYRDMSRYVEAESLYERAIKIVEKVSGANSPEFAKFLDSFALLQLLLGRYDKAQIMLEQAITICENSLGTEHSETATSYGNLGFLFSEKGDLSGAIRLNEKALRIYEKVYGANHVHVAIMLSNIAILYEEHDNSLLSEKLLLRALAIYEKNSPEHPNIAVVLTNLGNSYKARGDYTRAEALYQRALQIEEKTLSPEHPTTAGTIYNLAVTYRAIGNYAASEKLLLRALNIQEKSLGANHQSVAIILNELGVLYWVKGDYTQAEVSIRRAIKINEQILKPQSIGFATLFINLGGIFYDKGDYAQAENFFSKSLSIIQNTFGEKSPRLISPLENFVVLYLAKNNAAQAAAYMMRVMEISEKDLSTIIGAGSEEQRRAYMNTLISQNNFTASMHLQRMPNNLDAARLALTTILRRKGRLLDATSDQVGALRRRLSAQDKILLEQLISVRSQLAALIIKGLGKTSPTQYQAAVTKLQSENERLESLISTRSAEFRVESQPLTIDRMQAAIPNDAALVEIVVYRPYDIKAKKTADRYGTSRYAAYVLRHDGSLSWVDLGEASVIDRDVAKLRKALNDTQLTDSAIIKQLARALDAKLMVPIRRLLGDTRQVLLSPDGELNLLPFGALVDERGKYLIENYSFTYLTSGRDLLRLQVKAENTQAPVIFANPSFDTGVTSGSPDLAQTDVSRGRRAGDFREEEWKALPATQDEAADIKAIMPDARVFTAAEATEGAIKRIEQPRILHIASHGFFLEDRKDEKSIENPLLRSGLILAGANKRQSGAGEDGVLTALEVAGLNLWGTKLVVLSACDTGIGDVQNGEGVYGLRRALVLAGAESQLLSLWKVADEPTRELMVDFYRRLQRGEGRTEALRQAQLTMLRGAKKPQQQHPYFWAAFIQSGDWRSINSVESNAK